MGKSIVSEIHPSQIPDAAEFLTRTFMRLNPPWFRYAFNLPEYEQEYLDQLADTITRKNLPSASPRSVQVSIIPSVKSDTEGTTDLPTEDGKQYLCLVFHIFLQTRKIFLISHLHSNVKI